MIETLDIEMQVWRRRKVEIAEDVWRQQRVKFVRRKPTVEEVLEVLEEMVRGKK